MQATMIIYLHRLHFVSKLVPLLLNQAMVLLTYLLTDNAMERH